MQTSDHSFPTKQTRVPKKVLEKEDFLNLLVTQLKNQDPLEPQSNQEFMTAMAQFNSVETLASLDRNVQYSRAMSMIDKRVTVQLDSGEPVSGKVEKAGMTDGKVVVYLDGKEYMLSDVKEIVFQDDSRGAAGSDLVQAALLIGKEVLVGQENSRLIGIVEKVGLVGGSVMTYINGSPYDLGAVMEIAQTGAGSGAGVGNNEG